MLMGRFMRDLSIVASIIMLPCAVLADARTALYEAKAKEIDCDSAPNTTLTEWANCRCRAFGGHDLRGIGIDQILEEKCRAEKDLVVDVESGKLKTTKDISIRLQSIGLNFSNGLVAAREQARSYQAAPSPRPQADPSLAGLAEHLQNSPKWQESLCMMMGQAACENERRIHLLRAHEETVRAGVPGALEDAQRTQMLLEQEKQTRELEEINHKLFMLRANER